MTSKLYTSILAAALAMTAWSCKNDDTDFEKLAADAKGEPIEITLPDTPLQEEPDQVPEPSAANYNDYVESFSPSVSVEVKFDGDKAEATSSSSRVTVACEGAHVTANISTKAVRFHLTGSSENASLTVNGDNRFEIRLDNVSITNPAGAAINNNSSKTLYIVSMEGTENTLASTGGNPDATTAKACLFSEGQIAFSGKGVLNVNSAFRNGVASDDYIFVRPQARLNVSCSSGNCLKANDGVTIDGGSINLSSSYDGGKGINCESFVTINGGRTTIVSTGTSRVEQVEVSAEFPEGTDVTGSAGAKSDGIFLVTGGELAIKCTGDEAKGINCNLDYVQTGGSVRVVTLGQKVLSSPKGIKADGMIDVSGGYLYVYSRHSNPLDAAGGVEVFSYKQQKYYLIETP